MWSLKFNLSNEERDCSPLTQDFAGDRESIDSEGLLFSFNLPLFLF